MLQLFQFSLLLGIVLFTPIGASAAEECFCLRHAASEAVLRGCSGFRPAQDFYETGICIDPLTGKQREVTIDSNWKRLTAGKVGCDPCRPKPKERDGKVERPRKGDPPGAKD